MGGLRYLRKMTHYWMVMVISCFGTVHLQYINTGGPSAESVLGPLDSTLYYSLPYSNYFNPSNNNFEQEANGSEMANALYTDPGLQPEEIIQEPSTRDRRTTKQEVHQNDFNETKSSEKLANEDLLRRGNPAKRAVLLQELAQMLHNAEGNSLVRLQEKKNFSPWGGKRRDTSMNNGNVGQAYVWKRSHNAPTATMPKRIRFSPWGGKRNGQVLYKQGPKNSRIIFSTTVPIRIMTNYLPYEGLNLAGFHVVPMLDKRQAIKILALPSNLDNDMAAPEGLPVKSFLQVLPKMFKPGRPYYDMNIKKDGKRKVKFSAWGGKRSPPIIGPIWTPASDDVKDATLNALVLIRNSQNYKKNNMATF